MRRIAAELICPDTTLTTDNKLKETMLLSLHKQQEYTEGVYMYMVLNKEAPEYINLAYIHTIPHAVPNLGTLVCLGQG